MGRLFVICPKCKTEFFTGFNIPLSSLGEGNGTICPKCGSAVSLTKTNVKEK